MGLEIIITLAIALGLPGAAGITVAYSVWRERHPKALSWKERRAVAAKKRAKKKQDKLQAIEDARKAEQAEIEAAREKSAREIRELIEANRPKALLAAWDEEFKALAEPALASKEIKSGRKDFDLELERRKEQWSRETYQIHQDADTGFYELVKPIKYKSANGHVIMDCSCDDCHEESSRFLLKAIADLEKLR